MALTLGRLVEGLRRQGHTVSVVRPRRPEDIRHLFDDHEDQNAGAGVTVVGGVPLPGYRGVQIGLPAGAMLTRLWRRHRADVVYVATEGPLGLSAVGAARRAGIPVFSGFHTNFHAYSSHYRLAWFGWAILRYLCWFHNRTNGAVVASADLRDRLHDLGVRRVSVLGRGVDSRLFNPGRRCAALRREWGAADDDLIAVYVGRVAAEKNLELAVDAYRAMKAVSRSARLVIVGDGPLRAALQRRHSDVVFSGVQTGEQLAMHYASADVFLFPSETDTFGNVTLEAMASGLAVVAYDYAAAHLHITNGETGVLTPLGDRSAFVRSAATIAAQPRSLRTMGARARLYARGLDWASVVERFLAILLEADSLERSPHAA